MKRFILIIISVLFLTGCVNIQNSNFDQLINEAINSNERIYNTYRTGYKFYLPANLYVSDSKEYNEVLKSDNAVFYLYIDIIGYQNKEVEQYEENKTSYYSRRFEANGKTGYIEINAKNDKYLVEIMYNYAKIEVIVDESSLKSSVAEAIIVLSSIYYNDGILGNISSENVLNYNEENVDIFDINGNENSNFLEYVETYDIIEDDSVPDYDVIN